MATKEDVEQAISHINDTWNGNAKYGVYGTTLDAVEISNIRGMNARFEFPWPVVAIAGTNGCGKTTALQMASTAYVQRVSTARYYTVGRWVRPAFAAVNEASPVRDASHIKYEFSDDSPPITVAYHPAQRRWRYPRRGNPERFVQFIGIGNYAPRIETVDRTHLSRSRLEIRHSVEIDDRIVQSISRILGNTYQNASIHTVSVPDAAWTAEVPMLSRDGIRYAESNMGAGEQKLVRLVRVLEELPSKSLILLEEPELTLHSDAQYGFAWYLMTLARRKGHQIIVATHSEQIFEALPPEGRILISRELGSTNVVAHAPRLSAARALSNSVRTNRDLVFVEDSVAASFLDNIFQRFSGDLIRNATIVEVGSTREVLKLVRRLRATGVRAVGVRDPDIGPAPAEGMFSLPGLQSVEELLLHPENIERTEEILSGVRAAFARALALGGQRGNASERAKRVLAALALELRKSDSFVADRLALGWLMNAANGEAARRLTLDIRQCLDELNG